jgi:hypothetical protein
MPVIVAVHSRKEPRPQLSLLNATLTHEEPTGPVKMLIKGSLLKLPPLSGHIVKRSRRPAVASNVYSIAFDPVYEPETVCTDVVGVSATAEQTTYLELEKNGHGVQLSSEHPVGMHVPLQHTRATSNAIGDPILLTGWRAFFKKT